MGWEGERKRRWGCERVERGVIVDLDEPYLYLAIPSQRGGFDSRVREEGRRAFEGEKRGGDISQNSSWHQPLRSKFQIFRQ